MRRIIILGVVVFLVAALWSGAWLWAAGQIGAYEKQLEAADGVNAPRLACGSFTVTGFPFGFDLTCAPATIVLEDTTVTVAGLKASAEVYNPFFVLASAKSPATVADAFTGSQSRLDFAGADASIRLTGWRIARASVVVEAPVWNDTVLEDRLIGKADHVEAHLIDVPDKHDEKAGLATADTYVEIDNAAAPGFGIVAGKGTLDGEITNLPDDLRTYVYPDTLRAWQAAGGQFLLRGLNGDDGARNFAATGNLGLDAQGHAQGQIKVKSTGVVEALGPMLPDQIRGLVTGAPAADGSYSQTLNIAGGMIFVGLLPTGVLLPTAY